MASKLNSKSALFLIQTHNEYLDKLNRIKALKSTREIDLYNLATETANAGTFAAVVTNDITNGIPVLESRDIIRLIRSIYRVIECRKLSSEAEQLLNANESEIKERQSILKPAASGFKRLFMSSASKLSATMAMERLAELANGSYAQKIKELSQGADGLDTISTDLSIQAYNANKTSFKATLSSIAPGVFARLDTLPAITEICKRVNRIETELEYVKKLSEGLRENVKKAADRLAAEACLDALDTIPIDQINQYSSGIRVKALKAGGINTVADAYMAGEYKLALIPGISEDGAHTVRQFAKKCRNDVFETIKLKISADERTPSTTALIQALYIYKNNLSKTAMASGLMRGEGKPIFYAVKSVNALTSFASWIFMDDFERSAIRNSYNYLLGQECISFCERTGQYINQAKVSSVPSDTVWDDFLVHNIEYFRLLEEIAPGLFGGSDKDYGLPEELAREIRDQAYFPDGLKCDLFAYQVLGVKYILHQEKVLLGDEMGLGKTVQAIATMVSLKNTGATHFIVVCPASVLLNWYKEVEAKSKLSAIMVYGAKRLTAIKAWLKEGGVAVTTYETAEHFKLDENFKYSMLTVDEAHYIKNTEAKRSRNVRRLAKQAERILYMTGTPMENNVEEMVTLISDLNPYIASEIQRNALLVSAPVFRNKIIPVYYRRKKEDVLKDLPDLIENKDWCFMTKEERTVYESAVLSRNYSESRRVSWNVENIAFSSKANRMLEIIEDARVDNRKVLIFSYFLNTIARIQKLLGNKCLQPINGSVPVSRRQEIIDEFGKAPAGSVLLAQITSGGTGLNIQSASVVIICEPQLKPSIESQAIARAHRMGQGQKVLVHRLLCENSIDERITDLLAEKQRLFDEYADESVAAQAESVSIDEKSLRKIIEEEIERIKAKQAQEKQDDTSAEEQQSYAEHDENRFDEYTDESVTARERASFDENPPNNIIKEEIERIKSKQTQKKHEQTSVDSSATQKSDSEDFISEQMSFNNIIEEEIALHKTMQAQQKHDD